MTGNSIIDAILFGGVMMFANYFVFYKSQEGRARKSIIGGIIAGIIFAVMLRILG